MHYSLVVRSDCCRVVKDHDLCLEFPYRRWLQFSIDEDHTFTEVIPLKLLFLDLGLNCKADRLTGESLFDIYSLMMDAFHLYRIKLSRLVRA